MFALGFKETSGFFDWYVEWPELKTDVQRFLPAICSVEKDGGASGESVPKVLMVGCGNSKLSEQMYNDGYTSMVNVDISDVVIDKMRENYKESHPDMEWRVADARNLEDASGTYDCALDKGTVDALMSNAESCAGMAKEIVREMGRVIAPGGLCMVVSHNGNRTNLFQDAVKDDFEWEVLNADKVRLSDMARLINILRTKLGPNRTLRDGLKDPSILAEAASEFRKEQVCDALKEALVARRARRAAEAKAKAEAAGAAAGGDEKTPGDEKDVSGAKDDAKTDYANREGQKSNESIAVGDEKKQGETEMRTEEKVEQLIEEKQPKSQDPRRQSFVYLYVLRKPLEGGS